MLALIHSSPGIGNTKKILTFCIQCVNGNVLLLGQRSGRFFVPQRIWGFYVFHRLVAWHTLDLQATPCIHPIPIKS
jgi:hypothetical protein